jgi:hypothetical protein
VNNIVWTSFLSRQAIIASALINLFVLIVFREQSVSLFWLTMNFLVIVFFFYKLNKITSSTYYMGSVAFTSKIFWYAWLSRLVTMIILYVVALYTWDKPFYVGAVDAIKYHRVATEVAELIDLGNLRAILPYVMAQYDGLPDNIGVPLFIGLLYSIFGVSPLFAKVVLTLIGTGTVIFTYKTTRLIWNESVAKVAAIILAFFPLSLFYSSVILKEEFVVFLVSISIFLTTKMIVTRKIKLFQLISLICAMALIFLFRTAAGTLIVSLVAISLVINRFGGNIGVAIVFTILLYLGLVTMINVFGDVDYYIGRLEEFDDFSEKRISSISEGNTLATIAGTPIYIALSFISPFPAMVKTPIAENLPHDDTYYWIGGLIVWNFLMFFGFTGLWHAMKESSKKGFVIWGYAVGYSIILGVTAMFTAVRFGYNIMPVFCILIAVGISKLKKIRPWRFYLIGAVGLILAWNIFRLAGRGML